MANHMKAYFICPNGHEGIKKTSENDSPFSKNWEIINLDGLVGDKNGNKFACSKCGEEMVENPNP